MSTKSWGSLVVVGPERLGWLTHLRRRRGLEKRIRSIDSPPLSSNADERKTQIATYLNQRMPLDGELAELETLRLMWTAHKCGIAFHYEFDARLLEIGQRVITRQDRQELKAQIKEARRSGIRFWMSVVVGPVSVLAAVLTALAALIAT